MNSYLDENAAYWNAVDYDRPNVDHDVFRFYGQILKADFGLTGEEGQSLLDFGCGQGAAVNFFHDQGFDAYGVDISESDLSIAASRYPELAGQLKRIEKRPKETDSFFHGDFHVVIALQSLYYYSDSDLEARLMSLYNNMRDGGVFYASMVGQRHGMYGDSIPAGDGLRKVDLRDSDHQVYVNFTADEAELREKFNMFDGRHVGFYTHRLRSDWYENYHHTFVGVKDGVD